MPSTKPAERRRWAKRATGAGMLAVALGAPPAALTLFACGDESSAKATTLGSDGPPVDLHARAPDGRFVGILGTRVIDDYTSSPAILTRQGALDPAFADEHAGA